MAPRHELRDELSAENACGAGYEHFHDLLLSSHLALVRRDRQAACDSAQRSVLSVRSSHNGVRTRPPSARPSHEQHLDPSESASAATLKRTREHQIERVILVIVGESTPNGGHRIESLVALLQPRQGPAVRLPSNGAVAPARWSASTAALAVAECFAASTAVANKLASPAGTSLWISVRAPRPTRARSVRAWAPVPGPPRRS